MPHSRLYFLDWLRILALAGLIFYHVGMYYVSWDFHVKSPFAGPGLEPWMKLTEPWRMSLLFMVSGAATSCMLRSGPSLGFLRRRSAHLLLPLLIGVVLVVPPQSYFQVIQKFNYSGDYLDFLGLYFSLYQGFCSSGHCLILPTWNHLWFLPYLWVYTLLVCGLLAVWPAALRSASWIFEGVLRGVWLIALPVVLIFVARLALFERFPSTHALIDDGFNHVIYFGMFVCGATLAASGKLWERLASQRWVALSMAVAFWAVLVFIRPGKPFDHAVVASYQWSALVAVLGFAIAHLNRDGPLRQRLTEAVFPVYILHQTVLVVGSQFLLPHRLKPAVEGPMVIALTFVFSYAGYVFIRRFGFLRPWFGLKSMNPKTPTPSLGGA